MKKKNKGQATAVKKTGKKDQLKKTIALSDKDLEGVAGGLKSAIDKPFMRRLRF